MASVDLVKVKGHIFHVHRALVFPLIMLVLGAAAGLTIASLQDRAGSAGESQLEISALRITIQDLEYAAFSVSPQAGGSPATARAEILGDEKTIATDLGRLVHNSPPQALKEVQSELSSTYPIVMAIYDIGAHQGGYNGPQAGEVNGLQGTMFADVGDIDSQLLVAASDYANRAASSKTSATVGTLATIAFLLAAFGLFYFRSVRSRRSTERLATENTRLLERSQLEALTDALTGLSNRRSLIQDLGIQLESGRPSRLWFFDLDGFKLYNDTFGHGAGDALLHRFGIKLAAALEGRGRAYRMGGDEFCILVNDRVDDVLTSAQSALSESGDGWSVSPSTGDVFLPEEASIADAALHLADQRMYADKASRKGLDQRLGRSWVDNTWADRVAQVERLAVATSSTLGMAPDEVETIRAAASMYNVGLRALPRAIIDKPGALNPDEWDFVRNYPLVGERMTAAASVSEAAALVRSVQERCDGTGYPDGLRGEAIPIGSRVIAVCSAFAAMISVRPHVPPKAVGEALAELRRMAGKQFDTRVVEALEECLQHELATFNS